MGKKKIKVEDSVDGKVNLSPMIDCCFLLLIFFVVNATALTVSKDPSVAMPQTVDPTDLENAEGCIVVNVFDPPSLNAGLTNKDEKVQKLAKSRIDKLKKTIEKLVIDLAIAESNLCEMHMKLSEVQERNRKLDWLLTEAIEGVK